MSTDSAGTPAVFTFTARLNARLQPEHAQELFVEPLSAWLRDASQGDAGLGQVGTSPDGEVLYVDLRIALQSEGEVAAVIVGLEELGAPLASTLLLPEGEHDFGRMQGLGLYLDGQDLADEVYETCDPHEVFEQVSRCIEGLGDICSFWQGERETALYLYGADAAAMQAAIAGFVASYPLCQGARMERIA